MSTTDEEVKAALKSSLEWLEQGKQECSKLVDVSLPELPDALSKLSRKQLETIVLYQLARERFGGGLGHEQATPLMLA